jgi:hypothetical protein
MRGGGDDGERYGGSGATSKPADSQGVFWRCHMEEAVSGNELNRHHRKLSCTPALKKIMNIMRPILLMLSLLIPLLMVRPAIAAFDHGHRAWDGLLKKHVVATADGTASQVRYAALDKDRALLESYLNDLSAVSMSEFGAWSKPQRLAFLINAYNAFTVELILTKYPEITSIKDLGGLFSSPWKKKFFTLLGRERHLDELEHEMIRAPGAYDDPRIHVAVVCASVGCPALRRDAFVAQRLDSQLDDAMQRFLSDRSRNRFNAKKNTLEVSKIFDWYRTDFEKGHQGFQQLEDVFAQYAGQLADAPADREKIRSRNVPIGFLDYDWQLNDVRR